MHLADVPVLYQVLHDHGFPVPRPIDQSRHCLIMELIDAFPLCVPRSVRSVFHALTVSVVSRPAAKSRPSPHPALSTPP
ncbi:hypothetical protein EPN29_14340 [bacterium]|nr:MAG: hypothetical protein EPN29_14340 [bacterium]